MAVGPTCQPFSPSSLSFFSLLPSSLPALSALAATARRGRPPTSSRVPRGPRGDVHASPPLLALRSTLLLCAAVDPGRAGCGGGATFSPPPATLDSSSPVRLPSIPCAGSFPVLSSPDSGPHTIDSPSAGPPRRSSILSAAGRRRSTSTLPLPTLSLAGELRRALGQQVRACARPPLASWPPTPVGRRTEPPWRRVAGVGTAPQAARVRVPSQGSRPDTNEGGEAGPGKR